MRPRANKTKNMFHTRLAMEHHETAKVNVSLSNGRSYGKYVDFADSLINKIDNGCELSKPICTGRPAGSRVEKVNGVYKLVNGGCHEKN